MANRVTKNRMDQFIKGLTEEFGGSAGNKSLREWLEWEKDLYWLVQQRLIENGNIERGLGKGGSVSIGGRTDAEPVRVRENELYEPACDQIRQGWMRYRGYDQFIIQITAQKGRKDTGGTWSRPDISAATVRTFEYFPTRVLDIITFEIKPRDSVSVVGVYESLSHQKQASYAYVLFEISNDDFEQEKEADRILLACKEHGVGLILAEDIVDFDSWNERIEASRCNTDPADVDHFVRQFFSDKNRTELAKLLR